MSGLPVVALARTPAGRASRTPGARCCVPQSFGCGICMPVAAVAEASSRGTSRTAAGPRPRRARARASTSRRRARPGRSSKSAGWHSPHVAGALAFFGHAVAREALRHEARARVPRVGLRMGDGDVARDARPVALRVLRRGRSGCGSPTSPCGSGRGTAGRPRPPSARRPRAACRPGPASPRLKCCTMSRPSSRAAAEERLREARTTDAGRRGTPRTRPSACGDSFHAAVRGAISWHEPHTAGDDVSRSTPNTSGEHDEAPATARRSARTRERSGVAPRTSASSAGRSDRGSTSSPTRTSFSARVEVQARDLAVAADAEGAGVARLAVAVLRDLRAVLRAPVRPVRPRPLGVAVGAPVLGPLVALVALRVRPCCGWTTSQSAARWRQRLDLVGVARRARVLRRARRRGSSGSPPSAACACPRGSPRGRGSRGSRRTSS